MQTQITQSKVQQAPFSSLSFCSVLPFSLLSLLIFITCVLYLIHLLLSPLFPFSFASFSVFKTLIITHRFKFLDQLHNECENHTQTKKLQKHMVDLIYV